MLYPNIEYLYTSTCEGLELGSFLWTSSACTMYTWLYLHWMKRVNNCIQVQTNNDSTQVCRCTQVEFDMCTALDVSALKCALCQMPAKLAACASVRSWMERLVIVLLRLSSKKSDHQLVSSLSNRTAWFGNGRVSLRGYLWFDFSQCRCHLLKGIHEDCKDANN